MGHKRNIKRTYNSKTKSARIRALMVIGEPRGMRWWKMKKRGKKRKKRAGRLKMYICLTIGETDAEKSYVYSTSEKRWEIKQMSEEKKKAF